MLKRHVVVHVLRLFEMCCLFQSVGVDVPFKPRFLQGQCIYCVLTCAFLADFQYAVVAYAAWGLLTITCMNRRAHLYLMQSGDAAPALEGSTMKLKRHACITLTDVNLHSFVRSSIHTTKQLQSSSAVLTVPLPKHRQRKAQTIMADLCHMASSSGTSICLRRRLTGKISLSSNDDVSGLCNELAP